MVNDSGLSVNSVRSRKDLKDFIRLPRDIYRNDPFWVPPIWIGEKGEYSARSNAVLARSPHLLLLVRRNGVPVARAVFYIDPRFNDFYGAKTAFFGSFECLDDEPAAAGELFSVGEQWCRSRGKDTIRGPINPVAESWGFVLDGFERHPVFLSPHSRPSYLAMAESAGFAKAKDLLVFEADGRGDYDIPERFSRFTRILLQRHPELTVRRMDRRNLMRDALAIGEILNRGVAENWGFVPVETGEMKDVIRQLKPFIDPDAIWFVEDKGLPVGCCLGFPDLNIPIKKIRGRLLPFGWLTLFFGIRKVRDYRLWGLAVLPEYQGRGLDVLLYERLYAALKPKGVRLEANYILEDNPKIRNALEKLRLEPIKKYRVFEKSIKL